MLDFDISNIVEKFGDNHKSLKEKIEYTIKEVRSEYYNLDEEFTCYFYTSILTKKLREQQVSGFRVIDSENDLLLSYRHFFILIPDKMDCYLLDLTFSQFRNNSFSELLKNGYIKIDEEKWLNYLKIISPNDIDYPLLNDIFNEEVTRRL